MLLQIEHNSPVPIYLQLISEIEKMIESGLFKENDSLPSIRQLSSQVGVAVNTVARAYQELERRGLIVSNGRKGTFIKSSKTDQNYTKDFKDLIIEMIKQGREKREIEQAFHNSINQIFN